MDVARPTVPAALAAATTRPLPVASVQVRGEVDGPMYRLPSGVLLRRRRIGAERVSDAELMQAARGVQLLPLNEQTALARSGVVIDLVPAAVMDNNQVGSTGIAHSGGRWVPTEVRIATKSPQSAAGTGKMAIGEITQHEIGHVLAVLGGQDRSEAAADAYAAAR